MISLHKPGTIDLITLFIIIVALISACSPLKESAKYQFTEGYYKTKINNVTQKVYVLTGGDTIKAYRKNDLITTKPDTLKAILFAFPAVKPNDFKDHSFLRSTFDADVLSVLFKYRPRVNGFPPQFNATFNAALYLGYRADVYKLSYNSSPLRVFKRNITHYGYSAGLFSGFGTARIDEYVTNNAISIQYDGLVNLSGVAFIIALDKLTAGLTIGSDHLLDKNKQVWVNNNKLWIGVSIGLNIN